MSAGVQTTLPLALGLTLETGDTLIVSDAFACPIAMQAATFITSASTADVGVSWPLILGLTTPTDGAVNYGITSGTVAVPITMASASLTLINPGDVGISWPLALGLLLTDSNFTLVSGTMTVPIALASAEPTEFETTTTARRGGRHSAWIKARQRLALQTWWDFLTEEDPAESTKRIIKEVKAGRPIPPVKPPKGPDSISAEKLAAKIIPSRLWTAQNLIVDNVDVQKVVAKAIRIAQERDDEEVLMLL